MMRTALIALAIATAGIVWMPTASACSPSLLKMTRAQVYAYAREQFALATLVVDAEVIIPMRMDASEGQLPMAVLKVITPLKGQSPGGGRIAVIYFSSCDIAFMRKGERIRVLLTDGPELFRAEQFAQAPPTLREGASLEFNMAIDQLTGVPRPAHYSAYVGAETPPQ